MTDSNDGAGEYGLRWALDHPLADNIDRTRAAASAAEVQRLREWAEEARAAHAAVVGSAWWRAGAPARKAATALRGGAKQSARPIGALPKLPQPRPPRARTVGEIAAAIVDAARDGNAEAIPALVAEAEDRTPTEQTWLLERFARTIKAHAEADYTVAALAADEIVARRGGIGLEIAGVWGGIAHAALLRAAAYSWGRLGRNDAALAQIDPLIEAGKSDLLVTRAELTFTREPSSALRDVTAYLALGKDNPPRVGRAEVLATHLAGRLGVPAPESTHREAILARANAALSRGENNAYRALVNEYFAVDGLAPVTTATGGAVDFSEWGSADVPRSPHTQLVTVIVTARDAARTIESSLRSLLEQSHEALEIIVVDDASTDRTAQIVSAIAAKDLRVTLTQLPESVGTYGAKNVALQAARGDFFTFHDADDWAHPQRIERHLDAMTGPDAAHATASMWIRASQDGEIELRRWGVRFAHPNPCSMTFSREAFERVGYFDRVRFGADTEMWFRARRILGAEGAVQLTLPLGIGLLHRASLTQAGLGAWSADHHNPVRLAYQASWTAWHSATDPADLALAPDGERRFWAPDGMVT